ncbi:MAG TPA: hypothetical protein DDZ80_21610 [Cyanobacteria bacterium UBA8803]|nr:hypothetical protein [Cyanobacteria bacterium UBA9273]HBL60932.1 hypothetical protein [Cyanobacteria bacterium UBA8803]
MMPALLKRLLITSNAPELTGLEGDKTPEQTGCFKYVFFGEDDLIKGEVVLAFQAKTYSSFSFQAFGLVPTNLTEGVFLQNASGNVAINFQVTFAEGEAVDSLQGKLTLLAALSEVDRGRWSAGVYSSGAEVAMVQGTWSRSVT